MQEKKKGLSESKRRTPFLNKIDAEGVCEKLLPTGRAPRRNLEIASQQDWFAKGMPRPSTYLNKGDAFRAYEKLLPTSWLPRRSLNIATRPRQGKFQNPTRKPKNQIRKVQEPNKESSRLRQGDFQNQTRKAQEPDKGSSRIRQGQFKNPTRKAPEPDKEESTRT